MTGFRTALTRTLNLYAKQYAPARNKDLEIKGEDFKEGLTAIVSVRVPDPHDDDERNTVAAYTGSMWIDTESKGVLRIEVAYEGMPPRFPVSMSETAVEYDWVTIGDQRYLLPVRAELRTVCPGYHGFRCGLPRDSRSDLAVPLQAALPCCH